MPSLFLTQYLAWISRKNYLEWIHSFLCFSDAQNFVTPAGDEDKFGNRSLSTDFIWTYSTPDISKTVISCGIASRAVIFKKHSERATVQSTFVGRAEVIDDVTANPARIGFKLNNLDFPDQHEYTCFMMFDSNSPLYSNKFIFKIYGMYFYVNFLCLIHSLFQTVTITKDVLKSVTWFTEWFLLVVNLWWWGFM